MLDFGLPIVDFGLPIVDFGLPIVDFGLPIVDFGLAAAVTPCRFVSATPTSYAAVSAARRKAASASTACA
jgi:hypothetical protein